MNHSCLDPIDLAAVGEPIDDDLRDGRLDSCGLRGTKTCNGHQCAVGAQTHHRSDTVETDGVPQANAGRAQRLDCFLSQLVGGADPRGITDRLDRPPARPRESLGPPLLGQRFPELFPRCGSFFSGLVQSPGRRSSSPLGFARPAVAVRPQPRPGSCRTYPTVEATASATRSSVEVAIRVATAGLRRHHRQARSARPTGRAWIGSPRR